MFLLNITYIKPIEEIDAVLAPHRVWLEELCQRKVVVVSGPKNPRQGGLILLSVKTRAEAEAIVAADPFTSAGVSSVEIIEFTPVKYDPDFLPFIPA